MLLKADECLSKAEVIFCIDKTPIKRMKLSMREMIGRWIADDIGGGIVSVGVEAVCCGKADKQ